MNVKIHDLMAKRVVTAEPHHTVDHVRRLMGRNRVHAVPVVDTDGRAIGIVTTADLLSAPKDGARVSKVMTDQVQAIPEYDDIHAAARVMRKRRIHHVVVTKEKKIVGMISSFDLLKLVENHSFVMKSAPSGNRRAKGSGS